MEAILQSLNIISIEIEKSTQPRLNGQVKAELHATICKEVTLIRDNLENTNLTDSITPRRTSYASALQHNNPTPKVQQQSVSNDQMILLYPEKPMDSSQTKQLFRHKINLADLKVGINNIKMINNGGLAIETASPVDAETIKTALNNENAKDKLFNYKSPVKRKPTVVVYGVEKNIPPEELANLISKQNGITIDEQEIKFRFSLGAKKNQNGPTYNPVLEIEPNIYKELTSRGKVYIGMSRCTVKNFTIITRCFHCNAFGHVAKYCREGVKPACGICAGEHNIKDCTNEDDKKCINCTRFNDRKYNTTSRQTNHTAYDKTCLCFKEKIKLIESRTDYG